MQGDGLEIQRKYLHLGAAANWRFQDGESGSGDGLSFKLKGRRRARTAFGAGAGARCVRRPT